DLLEVEALAREVGALDRAEGLRVERQDLLERAIEERPERLGAPGHCGIGKRRGGARRRREEDRHALPSQELGRREGCGRESGGVAPWGHGAVLRGRQRPFASDATWTTFVRGRPGASSGSRKRQKIVPEGRPSVSSQFGTPGSRSATTIR